MATFKFFTKGTSDSSTIYVRFTNGRSVDFKRKTSLIINPKDFNNKEGKVRQRASNADKLNLKQHLSDLQNHLNKAFNDDYTKGVIFTGEWLEMQIDSFFDRREATDLNFLYDYALHYAEKLKSKIQKDGSVGVKLRTYQKYVSIANKIKEFEKYKKGKRYLVSEVDLKFHGDLINFLHKVQKLNLKTTGRYITFIKTICLDAERNGYRVHIDLKNRDFKPTDEKTSFITLKEGEIKRISEHDFKLTPYLNNARDWLVIGLWTGARGGDLLNLTIDNLEDGFIEYIAEKTGQKVLVPLHWQVEEIVKRNKGSFPRKISTQKFNDYIKTVCKEVGLKEIVEGAKMDKETKRKKKGKFPKWELVSSHICRRSFATNHYGLLPTPVLMSITGHTTEKMFLNYIGKTAKDNAEILKKFWKEEKRKRGDHLEVVVKAEVS